MSRRRQSRTIETTQAVEESERWWADTPASNVVPEDWREQWAPTTLRVVAQVWRRSGAKLYATHVNHLLRDDLQSWLHLEAVTIAATYTPNPDYPDPEDRWAGFLYVGLTEHARYHFSEAVGKAWTEKGRASIAAFQKGLGSTEALVDLEREKGFYVARYPLAAEDLFSRDPALVYQRIEDLEHAADMAQHHLDAHGGFVTETTECMEPGCTQQAVCRGYCNSHYRKHRDRWGIEDGDPQCGVPGCAGVHSARGLCGVHYKAHRGGTLPAELVRYVEPLRSEVKPTVCIEEGCALGHYKGGRCRPHYEAHHALLLGPCIEEGCDVGAYLRGLCKNHYAKWKRRRAKEARL